MTRVRALEHFRRAIRSGGASSCLLFLVLLLCAASGCAIADEDRCGDGYVYQKPGCFPLPDGSHADSTDGAVDGGGEGSKTCMQISLCKQACGDATCRDACAAEGCQSARETAAAVETCSQQRCTVECADPKATECVTCSQRECGLQVSACLGNTCS